MLIESIFNIDLDSQMQREKEAAIETILDRDQTILKFRDLVHKLKEQIESNVKSTDNGNGNANTIVEAIDFKQMFAESKAYTRAIGNYYIRGTFIRNNLLTVC